MKYIKKTKDFIKRNKRLIILFISIVLLLAIIEDILDDDIISFDEAGYRYVEKYLIREPITVIAKFITNFGGPVLLVIISAILLIAIKDKKIGITIPINLALAALTNFTLKNILQRQRPIEHRIIDEKGYSFPSGHSMIGMAFYGFLIYLIYRKVKNKYIKWTLIMGLILLIVTVGVSRIYLGVHYTSDVIAGFLVAFSYLTIYTKAIKEILFDEEEQKDDTSKVE